MNPLGLAPCPACGSATEVKLQTPVESDWWVRRAYFRCFACGLVSGDFPDWKAVLYPDHTEAAWVPLREFWNQWRQAHLPIQDGEEQLEGWNCRAGFAGMGT